ncbi:hypothetical protein KC322_g55 [Hortaea werneckii]|nr:hypothetical protein KC322_g55 [Hortaea werneckii]
MQESLRSSAGSLLPIFAALLGYGGPCSCKRVVKRILAFVVERTGQVPRARVYRDPFEIEFVPWSEIRDD